MSQNGFRDFDTVPKPKYPVNYKPRGKLQRKCLPAYTCPKCEKYFSDLPPERLQQASRHRRLKRPPTPEPFWDVDFPDDPIPTEWLEKKGKPRKRLNKYDQKSKWLYTNTVSNDNIIKPNSKPPNKEEPFFEDEYQSKINLKSD
ncbi:hypothetical protein CEXT_54911 [Caerostris extrusa]|uniref:DNA endonuclease activator Ctp1 C-terminal domain-containing protein n=1 Tax=Caerostris extrusa TaxID=172846 RepID=A0AAV4VWL8_CAEEX|nr:hypothetical protein CEXT_54911 [Caerostris extrusa]